ncbi:MAG: transposase, partial [Chitinophagaceae bacterium]
KWCTTNCHIWCTVDYRLHHCNAASFQVFLDEFSMINPDEFKVMVLDNGAFHKAKSLIIPANIALLFLPPYSPELNPAEKIWAKLKRTFTNRLFNSLELLSDFICEVTKNIEKKIVKSTCAFNYIFINSFWTIL